MRRKSKLNGYARDWSKLWLWKLRLTSALLFHWIAGGRATPTATERGSCRFVLAMLFARALLVCLHAFVHMSLVWLSTPHVNPTRPNNPTLLDLPSLPNPQHSNCSRWRRTCCFPPTRDPLSLPVHCVAIPPNDLLAQRRAQPTQ